MLSVATNACHPVEPMRGRAPSKVLVALLRACALLFALGILVAVADAAARAPVADGAPGVAAELIEDEPPDLLPTLLIADRAGDALLRRDAGALIEFRQRAPGAKLALPTWEHYAPVLVSAGAAADDDTARVTFPITGWWMDGAFTKRSDQLG